MNSSAAAIDKHRLAGLQDGVYSIAMTLLVLELKLPGMPEHVTDAMLWHALIGIWPKLLTWFLSFWVLAVFWIGDARALGSFSLVDRFLLRLSLWRLALVSLLPFSTAFIGEHGDHVPSAALYAGHLVLLASVQTIRHLYVRARPSIVPAQELAHLSEAGPHAYVTLACASAALALAFFVPGYNMLALLPVLFVQVFRTFRSRSQRTEAA